MLWPRATGFAHSTVTNLTSLRSHAAANHKSRHGKILEHHRQPESSIRFILSRHYTMRFLCACVVALSGLLAVRCIVFMPQTMKAAANILRGVLANDREWRVFLTQVLKPEYLNQLIPDSTMLVELNLTPPEGTGITPYQVVQRLVTHKGVTGTQLTFGIRLMGLALELQFAKTLSAHALLTLKSISYDETIPMSIRHCISSIQTSLVVYADKVAFFGHPINLFWDLNESINKFFNEQRIVLASEDLISSETHGVLDQFLNEIISLIENRALFVEFDKSLTFINILKVLISNDKDVTMEKLEAMSSHEKYKVINKIDYYNQVNVSSFGLEFGEKIFKITRYKEEDE